jgi:predicted small integral membrane protein
MTITLGFWCVPFAIALVGVWFLTRPSRDWTGLANAMIGLALVCVAIALAAGYAWARWTA